MVSRRRAMLLSGAAAFAISVVLFFMYKDPMILIFGVMLGAVAALVVGALKTGRKKRAA